MNQLQCKLLEMLTWLVKFLEENNIKYYVVGGTMLGAVRHKGFIPWDDDIDIALPRPEYERLLKLLKESKDHYVIESPYNNSKDYIYTFAKFYDTETTLTEHCRYDVKRGIYIDVFPLDGIGNSYEESLKNYKKTLYKNILLNMKVSGYRKGRKWWKNVAAFLGGIIPISPSKYAKKIDCEYSSISYDSSEYVAEMDSVYRQKEIMKKSIFGTPCPYDFEGITVMGPEKYDEYLTNIYGDWKVPPAEKDRESAHTYMDIDFNRSYLTDI